ncbi:MAG: hypothetical protein ACRCXZ_04505 [Patescibacteria group bacterium]
MSKITILKKISLKNWIFIIFIIFYILNVLQMMVVYKNTVSLNRISQEEFSRADPKTIQQEYENKEYQEVFLKNKLYQKAGEIVIDTQDLELVENKPEKNQFYMLYNKEEIPNWKIWLKCFFDDYKKEGKCF